MGKLFEELKRRKVFRVAAVYAVIAWVLIQVAETILPALQLPDWTVTFFIVFFILGFPVAVILAWAYEATPDGIQADSGMQASAQAPAPQSQRLIYATFVLVLLAVGFQFVDRLFLQDGLNTAAVYGSTVGIPGSASDISRRSLIDIGITQPILGSPVIADISLSNDGRRLVYSVQRPQESAKLYIQELDQLEARLLPGTEGATQPFFSPDGEWIGFASDGELNKISIRGGSPQFLAGSIRDGSGGFWSSDDTLIYPSNLDDGVRLQSLPASGGVPEPVEDDRSSSSGHYWPWLLPDGDTLMYSVRPEGVGALIRDGSINLLTVSSGVERTLIQNGYNSRYVPTGHIVFMRTGSLWAVPFDLNRMEKTGPEVVVVQGIHTAGTRGNAAYAFSDDGLLIYLPGTDTITRGSDADSMLWVDRNGNEETLSMSRDYRSPRVSPDGLKVAVASVENQTSNIWVYDIERDNLSRLTFDEESDHVPLWTQDGERIIYSSLREDGGLWWRAADGTGQAEPLLTGAPYARPTSFTSDGSQLVYDYDGDLYLLTLGSDSPPETLLQTTFVEARAELSPDGRWIAYESDRTGEFEVYVRAFPEVEDGGLWMISNGGGRWPKWSRDGSEIFYLVSDGSPAVWSAQVAIESSFQHDAPTSLFSNSYILNLDGNGGAFDISADGTRFLMTRFNFVTPIDESSLTHLVAVDNWFEELKRLAPPDPQ